MKERNVGIDMLKIVSMLMIVMLHILTHGRVYNNSLHDIYTAEFFKIIRILCFSAVNIYAIVSGYVGFGKNITIKRVLGIYLQVWFFSVGATMIYLVFTRELSIAYFAKSVFPILSNQYWYFTAYFALIFFIPILNKALTSFSKRKVFLTCFCGLLLFSCLDSMKSVPVFGVQGGYSFVWIAFLYFWGATMKKYNLESYLTKGKAMILLIALNALLYFGGDFIEWISERFSIALSRDYLLKYNSPIVLLSATFWVMLFSKISVKHMHTQRILCKISSITFGVYLLHDHPIVRKQIFTGMINEIVNLNEMPVFIFFIVAIAVFIMCALCEMVRQKLFKIFKINMLCEYFERKVNTAVYGLMKGK